MTYMHMTLIAMECALGMRRKATPEEEMNSLLLCGTRWNETGPAVNSCNLDFTEKGFVYVHSGSLVKVTCPECINVLKGNGL